MILCVKEWVKEGVHEDECESVGARVDERVCTWVYESVKDVCESV